MERVFSLVTHRIGQAQATNSSEEHDYLRVVAELNARERDAGSVYGRASWVRARGERSGVLRGGGAGVEGPDVDPFRSVELIALPNN